MRLMPASFWFDKTHTFYIILHWSNDWLPLYFLQSKIIWRSHLVSWWRSSDALVTPCPDATMASPMVALSNHSAFEKSRGLGSATSPSGSRLSQKLGKDKSLRWTILSLWQIQRNLWSWSWPIIPQSHHFDLFFLLESPLFDPLLNCGAERPPWPQDDFPRVVISQQRQNILDVPPLPLYKRLDIDVIQSCNLLCNPPTLENQSTLVEAPKEWNCGVGSPHWGHWKKFRPTSWGKGGFQKRFSGFCPLRG